MDNANENIYNRFPRNDGQDIPLKTAPLLLFLSLATSIDYLFFASN